MTIRQLLEERKCYENKIKEPLFTLEELRDVDLADSYLSVNNYILRVKKDEESFMRIENPTELTADITEKQLEILKELLIAQKARFAVSYLPPFYHKGQGNEWNYSLKLDVSFISRKTPFCLSLVDFGYSYGKININGIETNISHSGGTSGNGTWTDFSYGWHLVGENKIKAVKNIINYL